MKTSIFRTGIKPKSKLQKLASNGTTMQHSGSSPQHFCLRWNNYQSNLTNVFDQLLQSESFVDVTLACDGHSVKAHKMVLSACSPYFQSLFFENPCQHPIVIMRDIKWPELKAAVEFMYKGEINVSQEQIGPLLKVAESLKIRGLADVNGEHDLAAGEITAKTPPGPMSLRRDGTPLGRGDWETATNRTDLSEDGMSPSPAPTPSSLVRPPSKKRRRNSAERIPADLSPIPPPPPTPVSTPTGLGGGGGQSSQTFHQSGNSGHPVPLSQASSSVPHSPHSPRPQSAVLHPPSSLTPTVSVSVCSNNERSTPIQPPRPHSSSSVLLSATGVGNCSSAPSMAVLHEQMSQLSQMALPPPLPPLPSSASSAAQLHPSLTSHHPSGGGGGGGGSSGAPGSAASSGAGSLSHPADDMEIKPGIAEMIREEERAKLLESSHAWLGASTSSIAADSYQYQLQSMWQKCWNTNQSLVHNLRFRERGPLKSWRPETMAEAIFSVLKEGLSLSQAARKYDIPYPTFVLYANRVHNMLGPSADGGTDLRPKGRGRPQRILLGVWPDEHIRGVIRAVVFRDSHHAIKEEAHLAAAYPRLHDGLSIHSYGTPGSCSSNGGPDPSVSPGAAAAAAVAVVAQGLRQQMCSMVAAASQHHNTSLGLLPGMMSHRGSPTDSAHDLRISPAASPLDTSLSSPLSLEPALNLATLGSNTSVEVGIGVSAAGMAYKTTHRGGSYSSPRSENMFQDEIEDLVKSPLQLTSPRMTNVLSDPKDVPIKMEPLTECRSE